LGKGTVIAIHSLVEERITSAIRDRIRSSTTANEIFRIMGEEIGRWVPFVHCGGSIYHDSLTKARTVFSEGKLGVSWPYRWTDLTPERAEWLRETSKGLVDFDNLQQDPRWKDALKDNRLAMSGLKSCFRVPVVRNGRVSGSVTFFREEKSGFSDPFEFELLCNLPIDNIFLIALSYLDNEDLRFTRDLAKQLADESSPEILDDAAAGMIVNRLAHHYGWDAITVCRVNRNTNCYELQATGGKKSELIDLNFTQKLTDGIMGKAYLSKRDYESVDLSKEECSGIFVKKHTTEMQSELCVPIRAGAEIVAMLNIEDSRRNAFAQPEIDTIVELLKNIGSMVKRQKDESISNAAFDWAPSALFVTGSSGLIEKANPSALSMMGMSAEEVIGKSLGDIMQPPAVAAKLLQGGAFRDDLTLVRKNREPIKVNVASSRLGPLMGAIVIAKDILSQQRIQELEGLERIFSDIAAQTKVPLALVFSDLLELKRRLQASGSPQNCKIADDLEKMSRQLRRAEITYDHLALYDKSAAGGVPANPIIVEAGKLLSGLFNELPSLDVERIHVTGNALTKRIMVDIYQVSWALLSLILYGLRLQPESKKLEIAVTLQKGRKQWVRFSLATCIPASDRPARRKNDINIFIAKVIADLSVSTRAIEAFVSANGGRFEAPKKLEGLAEFAVSFPVTHIAG
jgi:PAS domain S-box-containing protein